ncbi:MAG: malate synthase, partial [Xanthobacteraceae bacterium]|nr:malate synthase [Xanthobacteraceae bacterium]
MSLVDMAGLKIDSALLNFVNDEAMVGTGLTPAAFWASFAALVADFAPRNAALLARRDELQAAIDKWHRTQKAKPFDPRAYEVFLAEIGYLLPEPPSFEVTTDKVDDELARIPGPQLVVPVTNARYALNAANARWGSLYDALYGTDALPEDGGAARAGGFNPIRASRVIARARAFLDEAAPLASGSHADATAYRVKEGALEVALKN